MYNHHYHHHSQGDPSQSQLPSQSHFHDQRQTRNPISGASSSPPTHPHNSPLEGPGSRPSLSPTTPAAHTLASLSRGQHQHGGYPPPPPHAQYAQHAHPHTHQHPPPHPPQHPHPPHPPPHAHHPQHNPYPPVSSGSSSTGPSQSQHGDSSGAGAEARHGRATSSVLAALASSDLEYPGIMRPSRDVEPSKWERTSFGGDGDGSVRSAPAPKPPKKNQSPPEDAPPKKRRRKGAAAKGDTDIPEDAEVEYADPDGDTTRGPVFVHPPKGAVQACVRCHRIKRKCDGAFPRCASCTRADVPCVFELSAATSNYVHTLKDKNAALGGEVEAAHARIRALEAQLRSGGAPEQQPAPAVPGLVGQPCSSYNGDFARVAISALGMKEHAALGMAGTLHAGTPSPEPVTDLISYEGALEAVKMHFEFNALPYPILDKGETLATIDEMYGVSREDDKDKERRKPKRRNTSSSSTSDASDEAERRQFLASMVLAIGVHASARTGRQGHKSVAESIYRAALRSRGRAIDRENFQCVQALCLLALWTMGNPSSGSIWQIVGLAGRVITAIGLHRRAEPNVSPAVAESRRRLFYAFYNIDRILAPTLCKPLAISEEDIDIELPTQGPDDMFFRGHPIMDLHRHVVRYRGLMGRILTELYSVNGANNHRPEAERMAIVHRLHVELDGWIVDSPGQQGNDGPETPKANYTAWWQIHYNQGLCMLYRPSPLYPDTTPETLRALYDASSRCVDLYLDMYAVNKTSFHLLQIIALFVSCISLLCCLCECDARMRSAETDASGETAATLAELGLGRYSGASDPQWAAEIRGRVSQCQSLFDAFGHHIPASARYRDTFFRISELLLAAHGPLEKAEAGAHSGTASHGGNEQLGDGGQGQAAHQQQTQVQQVHEQHKAQPDRGLVQQEPQQMPDGAMEPPAYDAPVMDVTPTGLVPQVAPGEKAPAIPGVQDMAGAWDAMTQLWFDLGDMFGDESDPFASLDSDWAGEWGQNAGVSVMPGGVGEMGVGGVGLEVSGDGVPNGLAIHGEDMSDMWGNRPPQ